MSNNKLDQLKSVEEYCKFYFENYNKDNKLRDAWLAIREKRYKEIRDKNFYLLNENAEIFKNEVLKFWEGDDYAQGYSYGNSKIRKRSGGWIPFQDSNGQTVNSGEIMRELEADNLELHGNYSWSNLGMGVYYGAITDDMQRLKEVLHDLFDENIDIADRFNQAMEIIGMGHGKASMFLHIKYFDEKKNKNSNKYGVWNSCTDAAFKIFKLVDSEFNIGEKMREANIRGNNIGEKYKIINERLKLILRTFKKKNENSNYGFENLSDVDIFVWYVSINFELQDGKVFFKKYLKNNSKI